MIILSNPCFFNLIVRMAYGTVSKALVSLGYTYPLLTKPVILSKRNSSWLDMICVLQTYWLLVFTSFFLRCMHIDNCIICSSKLLDIEIRPTVLQLPRFSFFFSPLLFMFSGTPPITQVLVVLVPVAKSFLQQILLSP